MKCSGVPRTWAGVFRTYDLSRKYPYKRTGVTGDHDVTTDITWSRREPPDSMQECCPSKRFRRLGNSKKSNPEKDDQG